MCEGHRSRHRHRHLRQRQRRGTNAPTATTLQPPPSPNHSLCRWHRFPRTSHGLRRWHRLSSEVLHRRCPNLWQATRVGVCIRNTLGSPAGGGAIGSSLVDQLRIGLLSCPLCTVFSVKEHLPLDLCRRRVLWAGGVGTVPSACRLRVVILSKTRRGGGSRHGSTICYVQCSFCVSLFVSTLYQDILHYNVLGPYGVCPELDVPVVLATWKLGLIWSAAPVKYQRSDK